MSTTRILIVEDDQNWLNIFHVLIGDLTKDMFEYTHAQNMASALDLIKNNYYSLVLLDLMLPDSQGNDTIKTMTTHATDIPIVIITTLDDERLMFEGFRQGIQDYLVKDQYDLELFLHVVKQAMRRFLGKSTALLQFDIEKIEMKLKSIDKKLETIQEPKS